MEEGEARMRSTFTLLIVGAVVVAGASTSTQAQNLLTNGNLDLTMAVEINPPAPGFFLPKPQSWVNEGFRTLTGPYEDEMSSEPWAGPAPTPVTTDGSANPPHPEGCGGDDCAVFFKAFTGNATNGPATGHLYQDVPGTPGVLYTLTGWAGAESNFLGGAEFALEFRSAGGMLLGGSSLNLITAGLLVDNGMAFDYKQYTVMGTAPDGTAFVRARASMIDGIANPLGGGQAYVVDDFVLVPEPSTLALVLLSPLAVLRRRR
jgi:hypothetical protein